MRIPVGSQGCSIDCDNLSWVEVFLIICAEGTRQNARSKAEADCTKLPFTVKLFLHWCVMRLASDCGFLFYDFTTTRESSSSPWMKPATLKLCLRALATVGVVFGVSSSLFGVLFLPQGISRGDTADLLISSIGFATAAYLIFVGYMAWFRWSPMTVRQILGTTAFVVFSVVVGASRGFQKFDLAKSPFFVLGVLLAVYVIYHWATLLCVSRLFPAPAAPARPTPAAWKYVAALLVMAGALSLMWCLWANELVARFSR